MSRAIRRVPLNWEHPRDPDGRGFVPLLDDDYPVLARQWVDALMAWERGERPEEADCEYFWEWDSGPPLRKDYMPSWPADERVGYQIYETVTEGTPISPVFATEADMRAWLLTQGHSQDTADRFIKLGWAPSGVITRQHGMLHGIAALAAFSDPS